MPTSDVRHHDIAVFLIESVVLTTLRMNWQLEESDSLMFCNSAQHLCSYFQWSVLSHANTASFHGEGHVHAPLRLDLRSVEFGCRLRT